MKGILQLQVSEQSFLVMFYTGSFVSRNQVERSLAVFEAKRVFRGYFSFICGIRCRLVGFNLAIRGSDQVKGLLMMV